MNYNFLFVDLEMTGLETNRHGIIEVAALVTNAQLEPIGDPFRIVIKPESTHYDNMENIVISMHKESGLYHELEDGIDLTSAYAQFVEYVKSFNIDKKKFYLAGNSIWKDREFLSAYMPDILDLLHYRIVDISTIKTLVAAWSPQLAPLKKTNKHRALDDIYGSIEELKWYRVKLFDIV